MADKHPADVLARSLELFEWTEAADMLRTIPALEAERDEARRTVRMAHELGTAIAAERDQLRAEVEALREANSTFATSSILPDDKVIVDKAEIEALRADAERYQWVRQAEGFTLDRMVDRCDTADDFDAEVDAARKQQ